MHQAMHLEACSTTGVEGDARSEGHFGSSRLSKKPAHTAPPLDGQEDHGNIAPLPVPHPCTGPQRTGVSHRQGPEPAAPLPQTHSATIMCRVGQRIGKPREAGGGVYLHPRKNWGSPCSRRAAGCWHTLPATYRVGIGAGWSQSYRGAQHIPALSNARSVIGCSSSCGGKATGRGGRK